MPLHPSLENPNVLPEFFRKILRSNNHKRRDSILVKRFDKACKSCSHMQPGATDREMYYKGFAQGLRPNLIGQLIQDLNNGVCPELHITLAVGQAAAHSLGYKRFGSPQDFLYGFTSERYSKWSKALSLMGFKSAVMIGEQHAIVTMAPRELGLETPTQTIDELSGAIAYDFWETGALTGSQPTLTEILDFLTKSNSIPNNPISADVKTIVLDLNNLLKDLNNTSNQIGYNKMLADVAAAMIQEVLLSPTPTVMCRAYKSLLAKLRPIRPSERQEQIALKYVQEGNLLQKLLGGRRVDHIQSNVKNQKNPHRGSGCEVDSIYRVVGEKAIVLVEAKAGDAISRSQLYQMYETFRLKLPHDWKVIVVGVLLSRKKPDMPDTVRTVIDMAEIQFDDSVLGRVTESLLNMSVKRHYRWLIHQD